MAPPESRDAYRLSKMSSLDTLVGLIVHESIYDVLHRFRFNRLNVTSEETIASAKLKWRKALADSVSGKWREDPKHVTCLIEDYYKHPGRDVKAQECWKHLETCLNSFRQSNTWKDLQRSRPRNWLAMDGDPFQSALVEGIPVYARPDLGYDASREGHPQSKCWVFDWKTGKRRDSDVLQIRYYALYAASAWGFPPEAVKARLVYLYPEPFDERIEVTPEALDDARRSLVDSYIAMRAVLSDIENNKPKDMSCFPVTERAWLCQGCSFQEICADRPGQAARPAPEANDDEAWDPFV